MPFCFTGARCEHNIDDCIGVTCKNGGTCIDKLDSYECACHPGFYGDKCEWNTDECLSQPCRNGGICTDGVAQYHCQCQNGFTGLYFEICIFLMDLPGAADEWPNLACRLNAT